MTVDLVLFWVFSFVAIASALGMLLSSNAVYSALSLIVNFATVAFIYLLLLQAPFIALSQVSIYAGAIMVLFLFVIMLLGGERFPGRSTLPWQRALASILVAILLTEVLFVLVVRLDGLPQPGNVEASFGDPAVIGQLLFTEYLLPFEITSVLLLAAMIGVIVLSLTRKRKRETPGSL